MTVEVSRGDIMKYATATEQPQQKYLRGDEAPPMFVFNLFGALRLIDMYEKTGNQGPLSFTVRSMRVVGADGAPVLEEIQTAIAR